MLRKYNEIFTNKLVFSNAEQQARLVSLVGSAAYLAIEITRRVTNNSIDDIPYYAYRIASIPNLESNITCVLEELLSDPSIQELFGDLAPLYDLVS